MSTYSWTSRLYPARFFVTANAHSVEEARQAIYTVLDQVAQAKEKYSALENEIKQLATSPYTECRVSEEREALYDNIPREYKDAWEFVEAPLIDYHPGRTLKDFVEYITPECGPIRSVYKVTVYKGFENDY